MSSQTFSNPALPEAIKELYANELAADIHFTFDSTPDERIPAHKCLLVVSSNVYGAMFSGAWREKDEVEIVDATPAAFKEFLQFFYFDEVVITSENVEQVLYLGGKYLVSSCVKACTYVLMKNLTDENVCHVYDVSTMTEVDNLKRLCEARISLNASDIFKTQGFLECDQQILNRIVRLESLFCSELELFEACMEWVSVASQSKILDKQTTLDHLKDAFHAIRFGLIKDELDRCFLSDDIQLTADLRSEIAHEIESKGTESIIFQPRTRDLNDNNPLIVITRERQRQYFMGKPCYYERPYAVRTPEISTFSTYGPPLLLHSFACGKAFSVKFDEDSSMCTEFESVDRVQGTLKIFEGDDEVLKRSDSAVRRISIDTWAAGGLVYFDRPVVINPGVDYTISVELTGKTSDGFLYSDYELKANVVTVEGITIEFSNDAQLVGTDRNLIYELHVSRL